MIKELITIESNFDKLPLSVAILAPDKDVKGIVQFSHGMAEHKARYYEFMGFLADNGYATVIHDHRGHGDSVYSHDDWGYFYDDTAEGIIEDLHQISVYIKNRFPNVPLYLIGHSMGSLTVREYLKKYDYEIAKLVVSGSPSQNPAAGVALGLVSLIKTFKGDRFKSTFINNLAFGSYNKGIPNPQSEFAWLSVNDSNVEAYEKDPGCGFLFTLNGFRNLFLLMSSTYKNSGWQLQNQELPIMFVAGSCDPCIASKAKWESAQEFLRKVGYPNVTSKMYEGLRHEIFLEAPRHAIYKDVLQFIESDK